MMNRTIERMRRASWMLHPACLIEQFLDQLEKLSVVVALPAAGAGSLHAAVPVEARCDERYRGQ